jgi:alkylated DNA repair dioxygenase AlkB
MSRANLLTPESVRGRQLLRKSRGYSDEGYSYAYNGNSHPGYRWPDWLLQMRNHVAMLFKQPFEFGLLNEFAPNASLGDHRDDEIMVVKGSIIACVSLGQDRAIEISQDGKSARYTIKAGSLYSMEGDFQEFLDHGVPQAPKNSKGTRYSITFRHLHKNAPTGKRKSYSKKATIENRQSKTTKAGRGQTSGNLQ